MKLQFCFLIRLSSLFVIYWRSMDGGSFFFVWSYLFKRFILSGLDFNSWEKVVAQAASDWANFARKREGVIASLGCLKPLDEDCSVCSLSFGIQTGTTLFSKLGLNVSIFQRDFGSVRGKAEFGIWSVWNFRSLIIYNPSWPFQSFFKRYWSPWN